MYYNRIEQDCQEVFVQRSASGRVKPWREHKLSSLWLAQVYEELGDNESASRVYQCSDFMVFKKDDDGDKLIRNNSCRKRLCPLCQWRRSLRVGYDVSKVVDYLSGVGDYNYIYLVLTQKNCSGRDLKSNLNMINKAWDKFSRRAEVRRAFKGTVRSIEITHNVDKVGTDDEYHPHMNVLIAVNKSYFHTSDYIKQDRYVKLWAEALGLKDYEPVVWVEANRSTSALELIKTINELAKYVTKTNEILIEGNLELTCDTVELLDKVFYKRKFVTWGGVMKDVKELLGIKNEEDCDLNDVVDKTISDDMIYYVKWFDTYKQYFKVNLQ